MKKENAVKLQERIAMEAVALLSLGGTAADTSLHEQAIPLIGEAWCLPADATLGQADLVLREKEAARRLAAGEEAEHVLAGADILQTATGLEILALTRGLFETALHLGSQEDRTVLFDLAGELEQALSLDEWMIKAEGEEEAPAPAAECGQSDGAADAQPTAH